MGNFFFFVWFKDWLDLAERTNFRTTEGLFIDLLEAEKWLNVHKDMLERSSIS